MSLRSALLGLLATTTVVALTATSSTAAEAGHHATRDQAEAFVAHDRAPGVVAWSEDGGGTWATAVGRADLATGAERRPTEHIRIASLTKPFLAATVLRLVEQQRLTLDEELARLLPGVLTNPAYRTHPVTVRDLLQHTSGIPDFAGLTPLDPTDPRTVSARTRLLAAAVAAPPRFTAGTRWEYSNTNYVLLGRLVERLTGRPYAEAVERLVLRPLRLRDVSFPGTSQQLPTPHPQGYTARDLTSAPTGSRPAHIRQRTTFDPSFAGAAGEAIATPEELVRFLRGLLRGHLLSPTLLREMRSTVPTGTGERYGLGLERRTLPCGTAVWGHQGRIPGSVSAVFATTDGVHAAAFHLNADWTEEIEPLLEAEFCP